LASRVCEAKAFVFEIAWLRIAVQTVQRELHLISSGFATSCEFVFYHLSLQVLEIHVNLASIASSVFRSRLLVPCSDVMRCDKGVTIGLNCLLICARALDVFILIIYGLKAFLSY
jgi:hypothetical protein